MLESNSMKNRDLENRRHSIENSFSNTVKRTVPTETISVPKRFYNNETKQNVKYDRKIYPIENNTDSSVRKQSIKRLNELKYDEEKTLEPKDVIYEVEMKKHYRRKYPQKQLIEVDVFKDHTNHKRVRISISFFNHSHYEYEPLKSVDFPIRDFKKMMKELNDIL